MTEQVKKFGIRVVGAHGFPTFETTFNSHADRALYIIKLAPALKNNDKIELFEA